MNNTISATITQSLFSLFDVNDKLIGKNNYYIPAANTVQKSDISDSLKSRFVCAEIISTKPFISTDGKII